VEERECEVWSDIPKGDSFGDSQIFWNVCQTFGGDECDHFRSQKEFGNG